MWACAVVWRKLILFLHQKLKKTKAMRNTDYNTDVLSNVISPDTNFQALKDLMNDLGLEMEDAIAL